jgi:hypothetical protein
MRFYRKQHQLYGGIDWHARTRYVWILNRDGAIRLHWNMPAAPAPCRKAITPDREDRVICVACIFTWYGLADLCARAASPLVLGHAVSMQASHGGKAKHDQMDAQQMAVLRRGGLRPQADV